MSLLGLLTVGRTFGTVRRRPPAYQLSEGWLPDFGRRQERTLGDLDGHEAVLAASSWPERNVGGIEASPHLEVRSGLSSEPTAFRVGRSNIPEGTEVRSPSTAGQTQPSGAGRMIQGELSLDSVRVVRNDLLAEDLELIPRPGKPAAAGGKSQTPGQHSSPAGGGWRSWLAHWCWFLRRRAS